MKKVYIVSLVMTMVTASGHAKNGTPDISIQNEVGICFADSPQEAYEKISRPARLKYPGHKITIKVVIETSEVDLNLAG